MRKVILKMNEQIKYETIKKLVETNGNKKRAAIQLQCTARTVNRLIELYQTKGKDGFVHKNRNRIPSTAFDQETKEKVIKLYSEKFGNANIKHFTEILQEDYQINISDTTVMRWLKDEYILSPMARKKTKRFMKNTLKNLLDETKSKKIQNKIKESIEILDSDMAHPRRPRCKYRGEMIQMDASSYEWIPGITWHLHAAIDDASGDIVGLYFDDQETLKGYYNVFNQILTTHGIPSMFYTDRRTVFEYKRKNTVMDDEDTFTQFSYACHLLGVDIKTSSVAQAKGRVERLNKTLQSRLPVELARANITTIEEANQFLVSYIKKYNKQFALQLDSSKSVFEKQPDNDLINYTLAVLSNRTVDNGSCIKYNNNYYIPIDNQGNRIFLNKGTKILMIKAFDGKLYLSHNDKTYNIENIPVRLTVSKEFDEEVKTPKVKYKPAPDHPWRRIHFNNHASALNHTNSSAYV